MKGYAEMVKLLKHALIFFGCTAFSVTAHAGDLAGHGAPGVYMGGYAPAQSLYRVELNNTQILRLGGQAGAVIIGNPQIADVSVHANNMLLLIGHGYGETNLIILDPAGQTLIDSTIQVVAPKLSAGVQLYNGSKRQTYNCVSNCLPTPILGDAPDFVSKFQAKVDQPQNDSALDFSSITNNGAPADAAGMSTMNANSRSSLHPPQ